VGKLEPTRVTEGFLPHRGHRVRYRIVGDLADRAPGVYPVLVLHGGPGAGLAVMNELERLAPTRPVVLYDQLGCAKSDRPKDPAFYTLEMFVDEVDAVRRHLALEAVHLFAHSWGGKIALEYLLTRPATGVVSLVLSHGYASSPLFSAEFARLLDAMPEVKRDLAAYEKADPRYQAAWAIFQREHYLRCDAPAHFLEKSWTSRVDLANDPDWDVTEGLDQVAVPTLYTTGRHDVVTCAQRDVVRSGIPDCEWVEFERSAHYAFLEEAERHHAVLEAFLERVERARAGWGPDTPRAAGPPPPRTIGNVNQETT
jgi:proline-specific peptidase